MGAVAWGLRPKLRSHPRWSDRTCRLRHPALRLASPRGRRRCR